jgi:hypothetical protein
MVIDARLQHPILFPFLLVGCFGSVSLLTVMAYNEYKASATSAYPPAVEERLRLALHYTHIDPDPETSSKYFMQAIEKAEEVGMDPFSQEALGIRIRFAQMLEDFGHVKAAIGVLDSITKDLEQKLEDLDQHPSVKTDKPGDEPLAEADTRKTLLRAFLQIKVKTSGLYESDYMQDRTMAKDVLSDVVGRIVKESKDPQVNGFTDDNSAGLTTGEIATILCQMGDLYATTGEAANAVQVYMLTLQPLRAACNGTRSCKEAQVLSNIASAMGLALKRPGATINGKPATKSTLEAARKAALRWADQAIGAAEAVKPDNRDEICELARLSAEMTRGDLLLENGDKVKSTEVFSTLLPTLREKNLTPLIEAAEQGLKKATA